MAIININIPTPVLSRVENAMAKRKSRPDNVADPANPGQTIPNPQSKNDFLLDKILEFIVEVTAEEEGEEEGVSKRDAKKTQVRSDLAGILITP